MAAVLEGKELEEALLAYCKNATAAPDPAVTAASFERGIGGTKADHIAEKVTVQSCVAGLMPKRLRAADLRLAGWGAGS